jgi:hypothetical protein
MTSLWQGKPGHLTRQWVSFEQPHQYNPPWMREATDPQCGHLPHFLILLATVHSAEFLGFSPILLTGTRLADLPS